MSAVDPRRGERLARVALSRLAEPGDPRLAAVVAELGELAVYDHLLGQRDVAGLRTDLSTRLVGLDAAAELDRATGKGLRYVIPGDDEWPTGLDDLAYATPLQERGGIPLGLWVRGPARLDELAPAVAVVGSRSATTYGSTIAGEIGATLAGAGFVTVSGGAFGIDQAAHRGALSGSGRTIAVLACGADRCYPAGLSALIELIAARHAVVSETVPGGAPMRGRFLSRNRIIAALSRATVVVEAAGRSGALNTVNWAGRLNRGVMGVPGPVTSATSEGVHHQIRLGAASLVTCGRDVLEMVGAAGEHLTEEPRGRATSRDRLSSREARILDAVPVSRAAPVDSIARTSGVGLIETTATLHRLADRSLVQPDEGGWLLTAAAAT